MRSHREKIKNFLNKKKIFTGKLRGQFWCREEAPEGRGNGPKMGLSPVSVVESTTVPRRVPKMRHLVLYKLAGFCHADDTP
jgi:hypothetical protein